MPSPHLSHRFADLFPELGLPHTAAPTPEPRLALLNEPLAAELGLDADWLRTPDGVRLLTGERPGDGARPVAQGYAGHQFGGYSPVLGDGRALLLGELHRPDPATAADTPTTAADAPTPDTAGTPADPADLVDLHLKGSGRTPFARPGSDGLAALGPMLREYVISEYLHAVGIPTTRSLAVVSTGRAVRRETPRPGAVLARTAASHLRVGTFQYAAALDQQHARGADHDAGPAAPDAGPPLVSRLVDEALARHRPDAVGNGDAGGRGAEATRARTLLAGVIERQAGLVAQWMLLGFVHGVMNTDNMTISGESIDFGPCAFMEAFDPGTVFSSIDRQGRYAYGNQPAIATWNLARFAETLLPVLADTTDAAVAVAEAELARFREHHSAAWERGLRAKLGLGARAADDDGRAGDGAQTDDDARRVDPVPAERLRELSDRLFGLLAEHGVDWTSFWADLADDLVPAPLRDWHADWAALAPDRAAMRRANPVLIPRNRVLDAALAHAEAGDLSEVERILAALADPFTRGTDDDDLARPDPREAAPFVTYCGT